MRLTASFMRLMGFGTAFLTAADVSVAQQCLLPVLGGDAVGTVFEVRPSAEAPRLIGAENGLFHMDGNRVLPIEGGDTVWGVSVIRPPEEMPRLIGAWNGLFHYYGNRLLPIKESAAAGPILDIRPPTEMPHLIGAANGLFRLDGDRLLPFEDGRIAGAVHVIQPSAEMPRLIGAWNGLLHLDGNRLLPVDGGDALRWVSRIRSPGEAPRLIGAANGLFRLDGDRALPVEGGEAVGMVHVIRPPGETPRLIGAAKGLYRLDGDRLILVEGGDAAGAVRVIRPPGETPRLIGAENGLFWLGGDRLLPVKDGAAVGEVYVIQPPGETPRMIGTSKGLFRYVTSNVQVMKVADTVSVLKSSAQLIRWNVQQECFSLKLPEGQLAARIEGTEDHFEANVFGLVDTDRSGTLGVVATLPVEAEDGGTIVAWLQYRETEGAPWQDLPGSRTVIQVNWSSIDHATAWLSRFGGWVVMGHALIFALLLVAARRSGKAWKILTDPLLNKSFLWFWFTMRHIPALQRWLLSRWFEGVQARINPVPHVPLPISGPGSIMPSSTDLATEALPGRRLWVQGNTGMGKTALVDHLVARYFTGSTASVSPMWTLRRAFRCFRYVAIPVALREHATVPVPAAPEDWIFEIVGRELARGGLPVTDRQLLKGIVTSGDVVLILDGANEVDDGGAIEQFALRYPEVGLVVTSQTRPDGDTARVFEEWRLPGSIEGSVAPLLVAWLGDERGDAVAEAIAISPIRKDVRSGYDVRLLADLIEGGMTPEALPETCMGLYEAMLARAEQSDGSEYPLPELCSIAWAVWSVGNRRLVAGNDISEALIAPLRGEGVRILRPVGSGSFEFRHDQMRGYLAARWAALHEVSPVDLFEKTDSIWRLGRSEQQVVWGFFAELIGPDRGPAVLDWSTVLAERTELQVALRRIARRDNWVTTVAQLSPDEEVSVRTTVG